MAAVPHARHKRGDGIALFNGFLQPLRGRIDIAAELVEVRARSRPAECIGGQLLENLFGALRVAAQVESTCEQSDGARN